MMNKIIINADDFGLNHEVNVAIMELLRSGRIHRTTIMVNMPYAFEAYNMAKKYNMLECVGLHINLTDGIPLSSSIKKTRFCKNGIFDVSQAERGVRLRINTVESNAVREEVQAQFDKFKEMFGYYPKHIDGHRHIHNYFGFLPIIVKIAKACRVESMRIGINLYDKKKASFAKKLYKYILNTYIRTSFKSTDYMGSWLEYLNYFKSPCNVTVEIMVHPTILDGKIVDIIYNHDEEEYYDFDKIRIQ